MRAVPLALAFLFAGSAMANAATDAELVKQLVGRWGETPSCDASVIIFNADGTFSSDNMDDDHDNDLKGTYAIKNGVLSGEADNRAMPEVSIRFDGADKVIFEADGKVTDTLVRCTAEGSQGEGAPAPAKPAAPAGSEPAPAQ